IRQGSLPITSSRKVQRARAKELYMTKSLDLVIHQGEPIKGSDAAALMTQTGKILTEIWSEIFKKSDVSPNSDFFSLGGDSLDATRMLSLIQARLLAKLTMEELYENSSLSTLANFIDEHGSCHNPDPHILKTYQEIAPLSLPQQRLWFINELAKNNGLLNI